MAFYSYFAYSVMLIALFCCLRYFLDALLLRKQLNAQYIKDNILIKEFNQKQLKLSKSTPIYYYLNKKQHTLEDETLRLFTPLLLKLSAIKSVSPALGLCFTVISIMSSFQIFSSTGDIKAMFQAASIGLGTTAIGACIIVVSKLVTDRMLLPLYHDMYSKYQKQVSELTIAVQAAKKARGAHE
jgi:biopolymer transport protein ExbB/TolQ